MLPSPASLRGQKNSSPAAQTIHPHSPTDTDTYPRAAPNSGIPNPPSPCHHPANSTTLYSVAPGTGFRFELQIVRCARKRPRLGCVTKRKTHTTMQKRLAVLAVAAALLLSLAWTVSAQPYNRLYPALPAQSRIADKDISLDTANTTARGAWSNGTTIWVTNYRSDKIYAYNLTAKSRDATKDFTGVSNARNIWSNGATMWVTDSSTTLRAYKMSDRTRDATRDIDARACNRGVGALRGVWSDGTTIWVAANHPEMRIYAYKLSDKTCDTGKTFDSLAAAGMTRQEGIWSDGKTMWVVEHSSADKIFAFTMSGKTHEPGRDIQLPAQRNIYDLWSDGTTVWLVNYGETTNKLYAVTLPARSRPTATPTSTPTPTLTFTPTPTPTFTPTPTPTFTPTPTPTFTPTPTRTPRPQNGGGNGPPLPPSDKRPASPPGNGPPLPPIDRRPDAPPGNSGPGLPAATPTPTVAPPERYPPPTPTPTPLNGGAADGTGGNVDAGIVNHDATPVQLYIVDSGLQCWFIGPKGGSQTGPALSSVSALAAAHPTGAPPVSLFNGQHPLTGKSVRIDYLPALRKIRISTYYADLPPHQVDKPYVFTVDQNNAVNHLNW